MKVQPQNVALIGKYSSLEVLKPLLDLTKFLRDRGLRVMVDRKSAERLPGGSHESGSLESLAEEADLAIVLGGDGTMLNVARVFAPHCVPILGVNIGRPGFLMDIPGQNMMDGVAEVIGGCFVAEDRMMLQVEVHRGNVTSDAIALNDAVVTKSHGSGMINLEVRVDGVFVYRLRSDGLIIATPTGSTAYSLSTGGPIVHSQLNLLTVCPISPHTLSCRPIVIDGDRTIEVVVSGSAHVHANFDNHSRHALAHGDRIIVRRSSRTLCLLHPIGYCHYRLLREKLKWTR